MPKESPIPVVFLFNLISHKNNNPRPGKEATRSKSTDGQQNELNDRRNTEQETKLVKNRNKISTEQTKLKEDLQRIAKAPQNCCLPESYFVAALSFC
jgi:hypothetical protein